MAGKSARTRVKQKLRRQVATASVRVPADRGPAKVQEIVERAHVAEARRRLVQGKDPAGALALLQPLLERDDAIPRAWVVAAEVHEATGDRAGALDAARRAVRAGDTFDARLAHHRLASAGTDAAEADAALHALIDARPRNKREILATIEALRSAGEADVRRFEANLARWGLTGYEEDLDETLAEQELVAADAAELDALVEEVGERLRRPLAPIARALDQRREWSRLADFAERQIADTIAISARREPALELRRAAARALTAGYTGPAQRLAGEALARHPDDRYARATWENATDQLAVVRDGWQAATPRTSPAYEPRPKAVLAMLAQSLPHLSGGYATRTHGLMTGLAAHGFDVEGVTRLGFPYDRWSTSDQRVVEPYDDVDGIRYHRTIEVEAPGPYPQYPLTRYVGKYADAIVAHARRHRPALLQSSSFYVNGLATREAAARLGVPYVYEMRGLEDLMKISRDPGFGASDRQRFLDEVELQSCLGAAKVFVITEALRKEMAARGVPEENLVVLPNGVHTHRFEPRPKDLELQAELGLQGKTVIGYAGGMVDYEGLDLLLEAVAELRVARRAASGSETPDFHLVVVGDGPYQSVVHATAERLQLHDLVTFTGRVPHEEVSRYLSLFDITPFPRRPLPVCELISPIKPFESMAMGRAVIVSSVAALTEIVQDGVTGLVFEKGSATDLARVLNTLIDDPDLRARLGGEARDWVRRERDWHQLVDILATNYDAIIAEHARGR
ncbi:glycosyltransferase family 4 protein [Nocardioides sp. TRM66260-LWL]|uniref:glycosyltransferase family 4 protein n=1 Tax=Nocardioides sp. TRM66260-LWL TaxID=2874478 RepID=UPI001CC575F6|nr:glycosyltransferase family 4 protein [Nocardioides sp. TRM66260-LWL]MBZ5735506.1 glycosyltransferase family 4 protein [Nocardioides sp. TRM66260-LWL]